MPHTGSNHFMKHLYSALRNSLLMLGLLFSGLAQSQSQGGKYFQQEVNYEIQVRLDDINHRLHAFESIEYINNSPDVLNEIWFHLWPNAYRDNSTAFAEQELRNGSLKFQYAKPEARGFIDSLDFKVDGETVPFAYHERHPDICKIALKTPLQPGGRITISTPFRVKIPSSAFSRLGHYKQQYQLCQWYPKPAVYDRKGWHPMPYLNQGEFYSEFGNFRVAITLPENYVIASSGTMVPDEAEQARIEENIRKTTSWMEQGFPEQKRDSLLSSKNLKTVVYTLENAHDFAWFADKEYHIQKGSVKLERSGNTIETWTYFTPKNAKSWKDGITYVNDAVKYYSQWVGDYPWPVCKALDGALSAGGGMEYPTITIISPTSDVVQLDEVIAHEVGHNWFYGILASNERTHPWMDEGTNSYYENRYMRTKYPDHSLINAMLPEQAAEKLGVNKFGKYYLQTVPYLLCARSGIDQALNLPADDYQSVNYGTMIYMKTAVVFNYLEAYLGTEKFDAMMQSYYNTWKFRHPYPEDFRAHAEDFVGEKLDWFFDGLIDSRDRVDYAIGGIRKTETGYRVAVKNKGEVVGPVGISLRQDDGTVKTQWFKGFEGKSRLEIPADLSRKAEWISVNGTGQIPDVNPKNDQKKLSGLFRKTTPSIRLLTGLERTGKRTMYLIPALGYNFYDGFMSGLAFHNWGIYRKRFEYMLVPMYGMKSSQWAGSSQMSYQFRPVDGPFRTITLNGTADRYSNRTFVSDGFRRFTGSAAFRFDNAKKPWSKDEKELMLRYIRTEFELNDIGTFFTFPSTQSFYQARFTHAVNHTLRPWKVIADVQAHQDFAKTSLTYTRRFAYNKRKKGLDLRFFAGTFLYRRNGNMGGTGSVDARFRLTGQSGSQDYLFDDIFLGRGESGGVWAQQMSMTDGMFALPVFIGQADRYLTSLNLQTTLPVTPLRIFVNAGYWGYVESTLTNPGSGIMEPPQYAYSNKQDFAAEAGVSFPLIRNVFEIYLPLIFTDNLKQSFEFPNQNADFARRIRFVLNVKLMNPIKPLRNLGN